MPVRRYLAIFMPYFAVERAYGDSGASGTAGQAPPRVLYVMERGVARLYRVDPAAALCGIAPGESVADARARIPELAARPADPVDDARALDRLADWCGRYSPWVAARPPEGLVIDVTGCTHLFGGEVALGRDVLHRLADIGHDARLTMADTPGAAWALATHGANAWSDPARPVAEAIVPPGETAAALGPVDLAGLGLESRTLEGLHRLGLRRIGDLYVMPRAALVRRFGQGLLDRLDRALGRHDDPISPRRPVPPRLVRMAFAEPIGRTEDVQAALERLLDGLCAGLERDGQGARRLEIAFYRIDGGVERRTIGTARASRDPRHLARLFADSIDGLDVGFGIEAMVLSAGQVDALQPVQRDLHEGSAQRTGGEALDVLVDRLINRLGSAAVWCPAMRESHVPERSAVRAPPVLRPGDGVSGTASWPPDRMRPVRLLAMPEPVEAIAPIPDDPPVMFRWRGDVHRVRHADGPERIEPEWWRCSNPDPDPDSDPDPDAVRDKPEPVRDYYRVEDQEGRRYWLFRQGLYAPDAPAPAWFLHGMFA
ncbi:DNA polymerase Y family protein [Fodinicurvata sp. EGI_FJ10296]|uniref:Y-family DNA polymerase n=1 Tax=Fodinicurvata sp. EGI_FJ10296 TaxID=3231908 RepID=UPI003456C792